MDVFFVAGAEKLSYVLFEAPSVMLKKLEHIVTLSEIHSWDVDSA